MSAVVFSPVLPVVDDPETAGFWAAVRRGELTVCRCAACGALLHLPLSHCPSCRSPNVVWEPVAPRGVLYSWTVVHHQVHPSFPVPYTIVLVELDGFDPAVRLVGWIDGEQDLFAGMPMRIRFETVDNEITLPRWIPEIAR
jgi:uncharacterized OB-fold protein